MSSLAKPTVTNSAMKKPSAPPGVKVVRNRHDTVPEFLEDLNDTLQSDHVAATVA
jgi:hypothetical protein